MWPTTYLAMAFCSILIFSGALANTYAVGEPTEITLEVSSSVTNVNDNVVFSGSLVNTNTGNGIEGKTITIYRAGPIIPISLITVATDRDGMFSAQWTAKLERSIDTPVTVFAQFDGDDDALPSRTGKTSFKISLKPLELIMTTDGNKNRYSLGDEAFFSVAFTDGAGNFVDPDFLRATYDGNFVEMSHLAIGRYTFETPHLVKFEQHQFGVFAEKWGFNSAQQSLTITTFGVHNYEPMRVKASIKGEEMRITVKNNELSPDNVYTFIGTLVGGLPREGTSEGWQFSINPVNNSFTFKIVEGYLSPGDSAVLKVKVDGIPTKLLWKAFDLYGKEHSTVREITGSGATTVKPIRS